MREELGSRNVSNKTVDMHSPSKISLYLHQKTILSRVLYLVRKLRSNPFQRILFRLETISLCGDIHQILHKWETCQQFCKSLYVCLINIWFAFDPRSASSHPVQFHGHVTITGFVKTCETLRLIVTSIIKHKHIFDSIIRLLNMSLSYVCH